MFAVYVLRSERNRKRYVGSTGKNPEMRLKEHNAGSNRFTKYNRPFRLIYSESFATLQEARSREQYLKSGQGRKFLDNILAEE